MTRTLLRYATIPLLLLNSTGPLYGHLSYTGRNLGTFSGLELQTNTISGQTTPNNWGWADGTDADFGHSHQMRFFRFTLQSTAAVTITVTSADAALMLPGFSLYSGLAHASPPDYENEITMDYVATLPGPPKEGAFTALATFKLGNDNSLTYEDFSIFTYVGHAADGTFLNYGVAPGIEGDGMADGTVSKTFELPAGNYTLAVGGAIYAGQGSGPATRDGANEGADLVADGVTVGVTVVPEPSAAFLAASGLLLLATKRRRS